MKVELKKISMSYGPDNKLNGVFTAGELFSSIYLLDNGWIEVTQDGNSQVIPPTNVNWAVPAEEVV